jgi:steroid 5-alpha reductase family enzyme
VSPRARGLLWVSVAYVVSTVVAGALYLILHSLAPLLRVLIADLAATVVIFGFSRAFNNSSVYDAYWSVYPLVLAPTLLASAIFSDASGSTARKVVVTLLVSAWAIRLTFNWVRGWPGFHHEDWRYVDLRAKTGGTYWIASFFGLHLFPTLLTFAGTLAFFPIFLTGRDQWNAIDLIAIAVTASAVVLEATADQQLYKFRKSGGGRIMDRGVWAYCRHPNYLGEISFWWGLFLFSLASDASALYPLIGPVAITLLFAFFSIPMLDKRSIERRAGYAEHMARLPALIPRFWRS